MTRNEQIRKLRHGDGLGLRELSLRFGLTIGRVAQICGPSQYRRPARTYADGLKGLQLRRGAPLLMRRLGLSRERAIDVLLKLSTRARARLLKRVRNGDIKCERRQGNVVRLKSDAGRGRESASPLLLDGWASRRNRTNL